MTSIVRDSRGRGGTPAKNDDGRVILLMSTGIKSIINTILLMKYLTSA